jgi:hypothetical protein
VRERTPSPLTRRRFGDRVGLVRRCCALVESCARLPVTGTGLTDDSDGEGPGRSIGRRIRARAAWAPYASRRDRSLVRSCGA